MPDLTIEVMGFCPQYESTFSVAGSRGKSYSVTFDMNGKWCDCPAFKYFKGDDFDRTCKHIGKVLVHGCLFSPYGREPGPNDLEAHGIKIIAPASNVTDELCPGCEQKMIPVRVAV